MLPAVMRWNAGSNPDRQALISTAMGRPDDGAAGALAELVADLVLPTRLRDVGVTRQDFGPIACKALGDILVKNNPRLVRSAADIEEILELAW
jgi:alcohol dehydrogenase class IV